MFRRAGPPPPRSGRRADRCRGQRVARRLQRTELHRARGLDLQQRAPAGNPPAALPFPATASSGCENSALRAGRPPAASRRRRRPARSRRCGSSAATGSSTRRARCAGGGSIHVPDGQPVHDRISDVCRVPSESTAKPGTPRLSTATVRDSKGSSSDGASWVTTISASARSSRPPRPRRRGRRRRR